MITLSNDTQIHNLSKLDVLKDVITCFNTTITNIYCLLFICGKMYSKKLLNILFILKNKHVKIVAEHG